MDISIHFHLPDLQSLSAWLIYFTWDFLPSGVVWKGLLGRKPECRDYHLCFPSSKYHISVLLDVQMSENVVWFYRYSWCMGLFNPDNSVMVGMGILSIYFNMGHNKNILVLINIMKVVKVSLIFFWLLPPNMAWSWPSVYICWVNKLKKKTQLDYLEKQAKASYQKDSFCFNETVKTNVYYAGLYSVLPMVEGVMWQWCAFKYVKILGLRQYPKV